MIVVSILLSSNKKKTPTNVGTKYYLYLNNKFNKVHLTHLIQFCETNHKILFRLFR